VVMRMSWTIFARECMSQHYEQTKKMKWLLIYDIWYDIYLLQFGFHSVAVVGKLVKKNKKERVIYKRRNKTKTQNTQNRKHKQNKKTSIKIIFLKN
jgi:hypothetical protein